MVRKVLDDSLECFFFAEQYCCVERLNIKETNLRINIFFRGQDNSVTGNGTGIFQMNKE